MQIFRKPGSSTLGLFVQKIRPIHRILTPAILQTQTHQVLAGMCGGGGEFAGLCCVQKKLAKQEPTNLCRLLEAHAHCPVRQLIHGGEGYSCLDSWESSG